MTTEIVNKLFDESNEKHICNECGKEYKSARALRSHINFHNPAYVLKQQENKKRLSEVARLSNISNCKNCGKEIHKKNKFCSHSCAAITQGTAHLTTPSINHCSFCNKTCNNINSFRNHERLCALNPNRQFSTFKQGHTVDNQFVKARKLGLPLPKPRPVTDAEREVRRINATGRHHNQETRDRISKAMKKVVKEKPESYSKANRGRTKTIQKYNICFNGSWELTFYEYCLKYQIPMDRNVDQFDYVFEGDRRYIPDFKIPDSNIYIEIKGYETDKDRAKWAGSIIDDNILFVLRQKEIDLIKKDKFDFFDWCDQYENNQV